MSAEVNNLFTSYDSASFDVASEAAAAGSERTKQRRRSWPIAKFRKNEKTGNEELLVRIIPIAPVKVAGAWLRGKNSKTGAAINAYLDSSAWDSATQTFNGPDPVQELGLAKPGFKYIVYCEDINHLGTLNKMGITPDRYLPYEEGQEMIFHPYRVLEISTTLMTQMNNIRSLKGSASDPNTGYVMLIIRSEVNKKISYQVIPGDAYPLRDGVLADLGRLGMPDIREYHEPAPLHEQLKTLLFCGITSYDKVTQVLESYRAAGQVSQNDYAATLKGMTTYASARGMIGEEGAATLAAPGLPAVGALPAPGALAAPGLGIPAVPALPQAAVPALPSIPAAPAVPAAPVALPSIPAAPAVPSLPSIPAAPVAPSLPSLPQAPAAPALPTAPAVPGLPSLPSVPGLPSLPVAKPGVLE
jgi:hypothetical protein